MRQVPPAALLDSLLTTTKGYFKVTQPFIAAIASRIKRDLLEPAGLKVPAIPIYMGGQPDGAAGGTIYSKITRKPERIHLNTNLTDDPLQFVAVLTHEMIHAALPYEEEHGPTFAHYMRKVGMRAPWTQAVPTKRYYDWFADRLMPELSKDFPRMVGHRSPEAYGMDRIEDAERMALRAEPRYDQLGQMIAYEEGTLDDDETVELFQNLLDTGLVFKLQGHYGRTAAAMLEAGSIKSKE